LMLARIAQRVRIFATPARTLAAKAMVAEKQKKQGGAPPMPGGGMGGMGGMDYPQLEFSLSATASGRPCGSVVSNFEQL
jgi:hypothetical protein